MTCRILALCSLFLPVFAADSPWKPLPPLPDEEGFAGAFAGVVGDALMVAGGTNFPDQKPWEGGSKSWYDTVYALSAPEGQWQAVGRLPRPNGYGVSLTTEAGLICLGGGNADTHFKEVFRLTWTGGNLVTKPLPDLPQACAFMAGTRLGSVIYVGGGIDSPSATGALSSFWALDVDRLGEGWKSLPACPGPARILPVMASHDGAVYLFSGASLQPGQDGKAVRTWLKDAWRYVPDSGWQRLADLPRAAVAAPSPAPAQGGHFLVIGGDDGVLANFEPKDKHPGFPRGVLAYDWRHNVWSQAEQVPFSLVTTPAVIWRSRLVIPGGEARPGKRSPAVWWRAY